MQNNRIAIYSGIFLGSMLSMFILFPTAFGDTFFLIQKDGSTPVQSCTESNGFVLAQNLTDLCDVVIVSPATNEIIRYNGSHWINVSTTSFEESTTCANIGLGTAYVCVEGTNIDMRSLLAGTGISVSNGTNTITITNTAPDNTVCANVGSGAQVYKDSECNFRTLVGSSDIDITQNANEIVIDFNGTILGGETTVCSGQLTGHNIVASSIAGNCVFKNLDDGTGITITNNATHILITNSAPDNTVCFNVGSGLGVYSGGECQFDSLIAGTGITITDTTDDLTFASQCANTGTGEAICESSNNINSLIAGTSISITDTTGDLTIDNTAPDLEVDQLIHLNLATTTMTNIGTTYVDIYTAVFSSEHLFHIDCNNISDLRIYFAWDYVGAGTQQTRWVDVADNNNVLYESTGFTVDQDVYDSGWFTKPAWCTSTYEIEQQGKSTTATDDPIPRVYAVHVR